ncbi:heme-binding protein 2-like [Liolophura sinensis]|uniref:heme-binding protein 2-like n=1 Tax=Liolophura sinensis TaxID=3198878 RepID=UPI0031597C8D
MMMGVCKLAVLLCLICLPVSSGSIIDRLFRRREVTGRPEFCGSYQCPNFTVVSAGEDYELRQYEPTTWVATARGNGWFSTFYMYMRLVKYTVRGYNSLELRMPMTVPIVTKISTTAPEEMMFMLPEDRQKDPPMPTNALVYIVKMPALKVYVRTFGGFASDSDYDNEILALKSSLGSDNQYEQNVAYKVGYNSPFTWFNRHNEVWLVAA